MHNSLVSWEMFRNICDLGNDAPVKCIAVVLTYNWSLCLGCNKYKVFSEFSYLLSHNQLENIKGQSHRSPTISVWMAKFLISVQSPKGIKQQTKKPKLSGGPTEPVRKTSMNGELKLMKWTRRKYLSRKKIKYIKENCICRHFWEM